MNEMSFTIDVKASKQKVWQTLWQDKTFREWSNFIDPGTYMVGELKEGNEVQFISAEGYGVTSLVAELKHGEYLLLKHKVDTKEVGTQKRADEWSGGEETYRLTETDGLTTLTVKFGVPPKMEDYFKENYPKAMQKIKELAETTN